MQVEPSSQIQATLYHEGMRLNALREEIHKIIIGNDETITFMIIALLSNGHILLEGVPGVAKTTMIKALTRALGLSFSRIQFTPDLLPSDLIGTLIFNPQTRDFETKKGPIFTHFVLADEINRAPAKVQSALLEAMQEHQVTIGTTSYKLEEPFLVFATQNPIEQEGTYRLPEAQVDRFMFKLIVTHPTAAQEKAILQTKATLDDIVKLFSRTEILNAQKLLNEMYVDEKILDYIVALVCATRNPESYGLSDIAPLIQSGVSPRATQALFQASRAHALIQKRHFVIPDDVKAVAVHALRHRISLSYEAEADRITPDIVIKKILAKVPTP